MENIYAVIENGLVINNAVADAEFASQQGWVLNNVAAQIGWKYINGQFIEHTPIPNYTESEILIINMSKAKELLSTTDWSQYPDVTNTANQTYLVNAEEFITFRATVRQVIINTPKTLVDFPSVPKAIWNGFVQAQEIGVDRV